MRGKVTCLWQHFVSEESRKNAAGFEDKAFTLIICLSPSYEALGNDLRDYGLARRLMCARRELLSTCMYFIFNAVALLLGHATAFRGNKNKHPPLWEMLFLLFSILFRCNKFSIRYLLMAPVPKLRF